MSSASRCPVTSRLASSMGRLLALPFKVAGRAVLLAIGFVLMIAGLLVSLTVLGAVVGIPMMIVGLILAIRAVFR